MTNIAWKDILIRALKTFVQTLVSTIVASLSGVNFFDGAKNETFWIGLGLSAGAAAVSAAWNIIKGAIEANATAK